MCNDDHSDDHDNDGIQGCVSMNDFYEAQLNDLAAKDSTLHPGSLRRGSNSTQIHQHH